YTLNDWREQLWKATVAVSSDTHTLDIKPIKGLDQFIDKLKELTEAVWSSLQLRSRANYKHKYLSMTWSASPYALKGEKLSDSQKHLTSHLRCHNGDVCILLLARLHLQQYH